MILLLYSFQREVGERYGRMTSMSDTVSVDTNFVVYAYMREDGTPYYIGKGRPKRPYHRGGRPCKQPSDENRIVILHENIDEQTAFRIEMELIAKYKRKDLYPEEGLLCNKSDGGEGITGYRHTSETKQKMRESALGRVISNETKRKLSESHKGKKLSEEQIEEYRNRRHSEETKQKMRKSHLGVPKSPEHRKSISKSKTGEKNPNFGKGKLYSFKNVKTGVTENSITVKEMCRKYDLKSCGLYQLKNKKINIYKGWEFID